MENTVLTPEEIQEALDREIYKQWETLAACIIIQTIKDYEYLKRHEASFKHPIICKKLRKDIEDFVGSDWYFTLCDIPKEKFINTLETNTEYVATYLCEYNKQKRNAMLGVDGYEYEYIEQLKQEKENQKIEKFRNKKNRKTKQNKIWIHR